MLTDNASAKNFASSSVNLFPKGKLYYECGNNSSGGSTSKDILSNTIIIHIYSIDTVTDTRHINIT